MENKIKVSIVVPIYNAEKYLSKCIESLINQTLKEIEIILINDCSTDGSSKICNEYAKKDPRIIVINNEINIKQGPSRNKGIDIAKGEYLGFVDSDDWISVDFYEKLYNSAKKGEYDLAKGVRVNVIEGREEIINETNKNIEKGFKKKFPLFALFTCEHWTAIYKKNLLNKHNIRYSTLTNGQDMLFLFDICFYTNKIVVINNAYYYYNINNSSVTFNKSKKYYENILYIDKYKITKLNEIDLSKQKYDFIYNNIVNHLINHYYDLKIETILNDYYDDFYKNMIDVIFLYKFKDEIDINKILKIILKNYDILETYKVKDLVKYIIKRILKKILR